MKSKIFTTFNLQNVRFGVYIMNNHDESEVKKFLSMFYKCFGFRKYLDKTWFHWFYNTNPSGVCSNYILLDLDKNIFIGAYGFSKTEYVLYGEKKSGILGINGMIIKEYGRKGLYSRLMDIALERENLKNKLAFSFPHGANIGSIKGHYKSNWSDLDNLNFYFKNKTNLSKKHIDRVRKISNLNNLEIINFNSFNKDKNFYFSKSIEWLNWRFINRPHKNYIFIGYYDSDNILNSYMVLGFYHSKKNIIRCQIVDYGIKNKDILNNLLIKAESIALENNADFLDLIISDYSEDLNVFLKKQYNKSEEFYKLLIFPKYNLLNNLKINALLGYFDAV